MTELVDWDVKYLIKQTRGSLQYQGKVQNTSSFNGRILPWLWIQCIWLMIKTHLPKDYVYH